MVHYYSMSLKKFLVICVSTEKTNKRRNPQTFFLDCSDFLETFFSFLWR